MGIGYWVVSVYRLGIIMLKVVMVPWTMYAEIQVIELYNSLTDSIY